MTRNKYRPRTPVKLLIVDDSWVLRKVLREIFSQDGAVEVIDEAVNGIEALGMILKVNPDVILLDMEMPTMDGLTTLQHLMIHTPTPTILLSSLTKEGSTRCFDAMKYGALDFISKNSFFNEMAIVEHGHLIIDKVVDASQTTVRSIDPMQETLRYSKADEGKGKVVFCEDCGTRHFFKSSSQTKPSMRCNNCGDEILLGSGQRLRRVNFVTILGSGEGGYSNLLKIIPFLNPEMGGALIVAVDAPKEHVRTFVKYLDTISNLKVSYAKNNLAIQGGCCYLYPASQKIEISPLSGNYTLQIGPMPLSCSQGAVDTLMISASQVLKNRVAGVLLSGAKSDGLLGLEEILKNKGSGFVLSPEYCLQKHLTSEAVNKFELPASLDTQDVSAKIMDLHYKNKENVTTA
jgi:two-component system chemotaxis response regulator CheB